LVKNTSRSIIIVLALLLVSCFGRGYLKSPPLAKANQQNRTLLIGIKAHGRNGDWVLVRGYTQVADIIADITGGLFSHVGILDKNLNQVIESNHTGVHATPLAAFASEQYRIMIIRPKWRKSAKIGRAVTECARKLIGKPYDFTGLIGLPMPDKYYCTELVTNVYKPYMTPDDKMPAVIPPISVLNWGRIIYDSGNRETN
jgi:uncharacterized protein YycO